MSRIRATLPALTCTSRMRAIGGRHAGVHAGPVLYHDGGQDRQVKHGDSASMAWHAIAPWLCGTGLLLVLPPSQHVLTLTTGTSVELGPSTRHAAAAGWHGVQAAPLHARVRSHDRPCPVCRAPTHVTPCAPQLAQVPGRQDRQGRAPGGGGEVRPGAFVLQAKPARHGAPPQLRGLGLLQGTARAACVLRCWGRSGLGRCAGQPRV